MKKLFVALSAIACLSLVGCQQNHSNVHPSSGKVESHRYHDSGKFGN